MDARRARRRWRGRHPDGTALIPSSTTGIPQQPLLELEHVSKHYPVRRGLLDDLRGRGRRYVKAVDGVSLTLGQQEILGIAGESGSGKTVISEIMVNLQAPTRGRVLFLGRDVAELKGPDVRAFRRQAQMIFQDPYASLNPRFTVYRTLAEPLDVHALCTGNERLPYVLRTLEECGLCPGERYLHRYPFQLSGGERQRVAVARALVLAPRYIIADEPTSMLDVSIRAGVLNLLRRLAGERHVSIVLISHDLAALKEICARIAVMYLGRIVEIGPATALLSEPLHPYSRGLIAALPRMDGSRPADRYELRGEIPDPTAVPAGCRLAPRCHFRRAECDTEPELQDRPDGRRVACHGWRNGKAPWQ
ncbi:MAG: ABC transporter ATP-binding protein [Gemmatimonadetes bacterium]|nr:ABC transporter ATP-binding protein [Gemmatimonadota bacterium]